MAQRPSEPKTVLSLDIGQESVKALITEDQGEGLLCHHAAVVDMGRKEENASLADFLNALKKELTPWKFDHRSVRVCLSGDSVTVRFIQVPVISKAQLLANISYESSKYIPFALKDTYFDCDVFAPAKNTNQAITTAVVAAVKREAVGGVAKILHAMGFYAEVLDVSPVALFNAFEAFGNGASVPGSTFAVLDVGSRKSHLGIVHEGMPAFARDLEVGGDGFTQGLAQATGMDTQKAEVAKRQKEDPATLHHLASVLQKLAEEIRESLRFFEAQQGTISNGMVITGGGALLHGLAGFLQQVLEIPVFLWNPFDSPKIHLGEGASESKELGPMFGVALGLAARKEQIR